MDDTRIVSGFGKAVAAQEYVLVDDQGRTLAVLSATQGKPALAFYNGKGEIRAWFTLTADERPDIRFFDHSGKEVWRLKNNVAGKGRATTHRQPRRRQGGPSRRTT
jgi:hypothetical protein